MLEMLEVRGDLCEWVLPRICRRGPCEGWVARGGKESTGVTGLRAEPGPRIVGGA